MGPDLSRGAVVSSLDARDRSERALAVARVFLAGSILGVTLLEAPEPDDAFYVRLLLSSYVVFSIAILAYLPLRPLHWNMTAVVIHGIDLAAAAGMMLVGDGTPFLILLAFSLLAAAQRWSFRATIVTALAVVALLLVQATLVSIVPGAIGVAGSSGFETLTRLVVRCSLFLIAGVMMGYVASTQKQVRAEAATIAAIVSGTNIRLGLTQTTALVFDALLRLFGGTRAVLVVHEIPTGRVTMWSGGRHEGPPAEQIQVKRLDARQFETYMFCPEAAAWHVVRRNSLRHRGIDFIGLTQDGLRTTRPPDAIPDEFLRAIGEFHQLLAVGVEMPNEWRGRLFIVDPHIHGDRRNALALGQRIMRQIAPTVYNVYLLRRLRSRSAADERARVARELHDGIVQSVLGVQIQLHALSDPATGIPRPLSNELSRLGTILRDEVVNLRDLMQRLKPVNLNGDQLMDALANIVQRFERETGISARFITRFDRIDLPPLSCLEVTRVVQEALVNVRKHSGARNVTVRLDAADGTCRLTVDDDGRGFPFEGRMAHNDLERTGQGPAVIKDRVRLLGGQMAVDSTPGHGARLEITFPLATYVHG